MAEQIYEKAQGRDQSAQKALLQIVELLAPRPSAAESTAPRAGSAKGLIEISPDFDEPLEDFTPYMA